MHQQKIIILMGSKSDVPFAQQMSAFLAKEGFSIKCEYRIASAHRTPEGLLEKLNKYEETSDSLVFITVAGLSDALSGVVAGYSKFPVIACPPDLDKHGWHKAFSSVMTPKGVPVLFSASPENAVLSAVRILSLSNVELQKEISAYNKKKKDEATRADMEFDIQKP